jgi:hypothetical protein
MSMVEREHGHRQPAGQLVARQHPEEADHQQQDRSEQDQAVAAALRVPLARAG